MSYFHHHQSPPIPSPQPTSENFHFVGVPQHFASFSPPLTPHTKQTPPPSLHAAKVAPSNNVASKKKKKHVDVVDLNDDDGPGRTAQRLTWSYQEDRRLVISLLASLLNFVC